MFGFARLVLFSSLVGLVLPIAGAATVEPAEYLLCRNQKTVRTVRIVKRDGECSTIYTKGGVDKDVGGGKFYQSCERILENIRGNLEKADWQCRQVEQAFVTHSAESP